MGLRNKKAPRFEATIEDIKLSVKEFDDSKKLRLEVMLEGSKYPEWFSFGSADDITLSDDGYTYEPEDHEFSSRAQGYKFIDPLFKLCDEAGVEFDDANLATLKGVTAVFERQLLVTKYKGKPTERDKPIPVEVKGKTGAKTATKRASKSNGAADTAKDAEVLQKALEAHDGELAVEEITGKLLKDILPDAKYPERKAVAARLTDKAFLEQQDVATLDEGVLTL